jgi:hypothetical protein
MPFDLADSTWDATVKSVAEGEYHLLLGAGASVDALNGMESPLPGSARLIEMLVQKFGLPPSASTASLPMVYEEALWTSTSTGESVADFLNDLFGNCAAPEWYEYLCRNQWKGIWTFNIDDVVEHAYQDWQQVAAQRPRSIRWTDPYSGETERPDEVKIVHLHGKIPVTQSGESLSPELVFSILEYIGALNSSHAWHRIFRDIYAASPFIVVGAQLVEEIDLAEILRQGNASWMTRSVPSLAVMPTIDEMRRRTLERWGIVPVVTTANEFFREVHVAATPYRRELGNLFAVVGKDATDKGARFLSQFERLTIGKRSSELPLESGARSTGARDLYLGFDPKWSDIVEGWDAKFQIVDTVMNDVLTNIDKQTLFCIYGKAFVGKSTALLRMANSLLERGIDVFRYRAESRLDVEATLTWMTHWRRAVLLFDGVADYAYQIGELLERAEELGIPMPILASERTARRERIFTALNARHLHSPITYRMGKLSNKDIDRLIAKLSERHRLGAISELSKSDKRRWFIVQGRRNLFSCVSQIEDARGFRARLFSEFETIEDDRMRNAYLTACMAYSLEYPVPIAILAGTSGIKVRDLASAILDGSPLSDLLELSRGRNVKPWHRSATVPILSRTSGELKYQLSLRLAKELSPYVTPQSAREGTLPFRLLRELMDHEVVRRWWGQHTVEAWYREIESSYAWNARFWEQRALAETRAGQFDRAESYAYEAVKLLPNSVFANNTLGTVLLQKAVQWQTPGTETSRETYERGVRFLEIASETARNKSPYPFTSFFEHTLRYCDSLLGLGTATWDEGIERLWNRWMNNARYAPAYEHLETSESLRTFNERWLSLTLRTS